MTLSMAKTYAKLEVLHSGFSRDYVRQQGLPTWWDDELDADEDVVLEGAAHISRRLGVDLLSLLQSDKAKFKATMPGK